MLSVGIPSPHGEDTFYLIFFNRLFLEQVKVNSKFEWTVERLPTHTQPTHMHSLPMINIPDYGGKLFTTGESILAHRDIPKLIVYITFLLVVHTINSILQSTSPALRILCTLSIHLPSREPMATTDLFTVSIVLPFPEYHL